jgi:SAM-dependent methyltransferase
VTTSAEKVDPDAFNAFEAEGWERRAGSYHDFFAPITTRAIEPLLDAAAVGPGISVLDVATGPGYVAAAALSRGAEATGLDVAAGMVELASRRNPEARFVQGDAERLPFEDGSFGAAVANFAILHVGRPERAAAELARVLRPGGRVALTVWDLPARSRLMGVFVDAVAEAGTSPPSGIPAGPDFFRFSDEGEFARLLAGAGFADAGVRTVEFRHRPSSSSELWDGMLGGTVRVRALIEGQSEEAKHRIRGAFERLVGKCDSGDGIEIPVVVKLASARKPNPAPSTLVAT